jgi:hypothetical protein
LPQVVDTYSARQRIQCSGLAADNFDPNGGRGGELACQLDALGIRRAFGHYQPEDTVRPKRSGAQHRHHGAVYPAGQTHYGAPPPQALLDISADRTHNRVDLMA